MSTLIGFTTVFLIIGFIIKKMINQMKKEEIMRQRMETLKKVEQIRNKVKKYKVYKK